MKTVCGVAVALETTLNLLFSVYFGLLVESGRRRPPVTRKITGSNPVQTAYMPRWWKVDTPALGAGAKRRVGSSPTLGTNENRRSLVDSP